MGQRFPVLSEMVRAFAVLALVLLNLSPAAPAYARAPGYEASSPVWQCGFADPADHSIHAPCHACRTGGDAVLPPSPSRVEPAGLDRIAIVYLPDFPDRSLAPASSAHRSRGPPKLS